MEKFRRIVEYGYLLVAIVFAVETVINWNEDRERAYLMLVFSILAVFMYFFKRRFRKKLEGRNNK
jgi:hypothetical protein